MNTIVKGVLGTLGFHLLGFALTFAAAFVWTDSYDDASEQVKLMPDGSAVPEVDVLQSLVDGRGTLMTWLIPIYAIGFLCAAIFLIRGAQTKAATPDQRSALRTTWAVLLLLDIALSVILWWIQVASPEAAYAMIGGNYASLLAIAFTLLLLAFYASTALLIRPLLAPSVPLAALIRRV